MIRGKVNNNFEARVESIHSLHELLDEMQRGGEKPDLRFIIVEKDETIQLWLSRETNDATNPPPPGTKIPVHYQLTGDSRESAACICAGNLFFEDDYKTLKKVNHKSGDFKPSFESLKWLLAVLMTYKQQSREHPSINFKETMLIEKLNANGGTLDEVPVSVQEISYFVGRFLDGDEDIKGRLSTQPPSHKTVNYVGLAQPRAVRALPGMFGSRRALVEPENSPGTSASPPIPV